MKVEHMLPEVYYRDSRDFAFVGRCFEVIFNYIKTGAQCVNVNYLTEAIDSNVVELMSDTVGFTAKHKYDSKNLLAVAGSFQKLLRNKGSIYSVELAVTLLMNSQKIRNRNNDEPICEIDSKDPFNVIINVPERLSDIVLLEDLFEYLLPAGMTYQIVKTVDSPDMLATYITTEDNIKSVIITGEDNTHILGHNTSQDIAEELENKGLNTAQVVRYPNVDTKND